MAGCARAGPGAASPREELGSPPASSAASPAPMALGPQLRGARPRPALKVAVPPVGLRVSAGLGWGRGTSGGRGMGMGRPKVPCGASGDPVTSGSPPKVPFHLPWDLTQLRPGARTRLKSLQCLMGMLSSLNIRN